MEIHSRLHQSVDDGLNDLPQELYQAYLLGVSIYFWDQEKYRAAQIGSECAVLTYFIHQYNQSFPSGQVMWSGVPIPLFRHHPPLKDGVQPKTYPVYTRHLI